MIFRDEDLGFERIKNELEKLPRMKVIIDIDPNKIYDNGEKVEKVAVWMEFGNEEFNVKYPSRPFWRSTFDAHVDKIKRIYDKRVDMILAGTGTAEGLGHEIGKYTVERVMQQIREGQYAPLAESTVKQKGHETPLIDTENLLGSIRYRIEWS